MNTENVNSLCKILSTNVFIVKLSIIVKVQMKQMFTIIVKCSSLKYHFNLQSQFVTFQLQSASHVTLATGQ